MGRSQYLLNRSKQRFKKNHGRMSENGGDDHSSSMEEGPLPTIKQGYQYPPQYSQSYGSYSHEGSSERNDERQYDQKHAHVEDYSIRQANAGDENDQADISWSFSGNTRSEQSLQQSNERQSFERHRYEFEQHQLQLRQEQLRQQEQLRWQQHQLQLQQEQMRQQEQIRQMRQQQQIRNQKIHLQQRHQYQLQQKQLREQQQFLEREYEQQRREQQEGVRRQMPLRNQDREPEITTEKKKNEEEGKIVRKPRRGRWHRQFQLLNQLDEEKSLDDLQKTLTRPKRQSIGFIPSSLLQKNDYSMGETGEELNWVPIDVRTVSKALSFLDRASLLQIPQHLAATLDTLPLKVQGDHQNAVQSSMGQKDPKYYGNDYLTPQQSYSAKESYSSALSTSYSRHQQNAALYSRYHNNPSDFPQESALAHNSYSEVQHNLRSVQQLDIPPSPQNFASPRNQATGPHDTSGGQKYDLSGSFIQLASPKKVGVEGRKKTSPLSMSSSSSRSIEAKSTITSQPEDGDSYGDSTYSESMKEPAARIRQIPVQSDDEPVNTNSPTTDEFKEKTPLKSEERLEPAKRKKAAVNSIEGSHPASPRDTKALPEATTPLHKNKRVMSRDPEPSVSNQGMSPRSNKMDSPKSNYTGKDGITSVRLQDVVSPSTIGMSVLDDAGPTSGVSVLSDEGRNSEANLSFPSLKITAAFTNATRQNRDISSPSPSRAPNGSPSPSEMLMTYTVTENGDGSSGSETRSNSNPSRRDSLGRASRAHSRQPTATRDNLIPSRDDKLEKIREKADPSDSHSSVKSQEKDLISPSSQDIGNEPPFLPPSSGRSLMDQRSMEGGSQTASELGESNRRSRSGSRNDDKASLLVDSETRISRLRRGDEPSPSSRSRSRGRERNPVYDTNPMEYDREHHYDIAPEGHEMHQSTAIAPEGHGLHQSTGDRGRVEESRNSRSTHASFYEPIHPYESTKSRRPPSGHFGSRRQSNESERSLEEQFDEPLASPRRRRETREHFEARQASHSRQSTPRNHYEEPSSTRAIRGTRGSTFNFEDPLETEYNAGRHDESVRHDPYDQNTFSYDQSLHNYDQHTLLHQDQSTFSSRRTAGQYRHSGRNTRDIEPGEYFGDEMAREEFSEIDEGGYEYRASLHRRMMEDYEDASNSLAEENDSVFSASMLTDDRSSVIGGREPTYVFEKGTHDESYFMDEDPLAGSRPSRKQEDSISPSVDPSTIRSAYATMTKALAKQRFGGKKVGLLKDRHAAEKKNKNRNKSNLNRDEEEDLDKWLESAMGSGSVNEGCGIDAREFAEGDEADLDAWLDNVICR